MSNKVNMLDFVRKLDAVAEVYKRMPTEIATMAVNFSKERFREQAWLDKTKDKWKPRKKQRSGRKSQTLLVQSGRLKRSIRKIKTTEQQIVIGTDVPYAQIHNDGGTINKNVTVKAHTRVRKGRKENVKEHTVATHRRKMNTKIPSRRFIGNSYTLERRIYLHIASRFAKALKS